MRAVARTGAFRARAESRMLDSFDIKQATGGYVYDPTADEGRGADVEEFTTLFSTSGRVRVVSVARSERDSEVGGRTAAVTDRELHIPATSAAVPVGAVAFCTAVDVTSDPTLLGARLRLSGPAPGSQTTARRLLVKEVLS